MSLIWMKSAPAVFIGLAVGVVWGVVSAGSAASFSIIGDLYLSFLTMCALPIMAVALIAGVARLFQSQALGGFLRRIVTVFTIMLLLVGVVSLLFGVLGQPGVGLSDTVKEAVGKVLIQSIESPDVFEDARSPLAIVRGIVPANIFVAFVEGNTLQILFFSLTFGAILGLTPGETSERFIEFLELIFAILQRAISGVLYVLPVALASIMASQVASMGPAMLLAMGKFVAYVFGVCLLLMLLAAIAFAIGYRVSWRNQLAWLKDALLIAFGARSTIAAMPSLMTALRGPFRISASLVNLVIPLGLLLCRYSMVVVFSLALCFLAQLYSIPLGATELVLLSIGSIVCAVATAGMPTQASIAAISVVAIPLGVPVEPTVLLLLAASPLMDPIIAMLDVYLNGVVAVAIDRMDSNSDRKIQRQTSAAAS